MDTIESKLNYQTILWIIGLMRTEIVEQRLMNICIGLRIG